MTLIIFITLLLFILGIIEKRRHLNRLHQIPIRIHINGTRGKSLLVRMITDMFQEEGYLVAAKITGERPQFFTSKTGWSSWPRRAPARIKEQMRFIKHVYAQRPQVLVVENMALEIENQFAAESFMVQSNLCVITNFRPDHQEIMGNTREDMAQILSLSFPQNSTILLPETELLPMIKTAANKLKSELITVKVPTSNKEPNLPVFNAHFALLKEIRNRYNISQQAYELTVKQWQKQLQPQNLLIPLPCRAGKKYLINLFSCNDVTSAGEIVRHLEDEGTIYPPYDIILTCRVDRPLRTGAFLQWILSRLEWHKIILAGTFPKLLVHRLFSRYQDKLQHILVNSQNNPDQIISQLKKSAPFILGVGNYIGTGEKVLSYLGGNQNDH